ncbi:hypothetical protein Hte_011942 [Hypoxylon texense]
MSCNEFKDSANYLARLEGFRHIDKERDELIKELIANYKDLKERFEKKCQEYDDEAQTRRLYQAQANEASKKLVDIQHKVDVNSFAFVIIDGNDALFRDDLITRGEEGGVTAANLLHAAIKKHLRALYPDSNLDGWNIIVQIALNLEGHTKSMSKLPGFARGFNHTQVFFSVVDVGKDKEQADVKVRDIVRLMLFNPQCKQIIFGPCHDKQYILQLKPLLPNPKLALLETIPATREFRELGCRMVRFPEVFRSEPLPGSASLPPNVMGDFINNFMNSLDLVGRQSRPAVRKYYLVNCSGERVDEPTPKYEASAAQRVDGRVKEEGRGPCFRYHLLGACDVPSCTYYHNERLGPNEQLVLKDRARNFQCSYRSSCNNPDCVWGHHCKYGKKCQLNNCCYGDCHDIDMKPVEKIYEDGSRERLPA